MARTLLSHHEVMPIFIEFLLPFRQQRHKKNFDFSGFRAVETWIDRPLSSQSSPQSSLRRQLQICYNLRCIESTPKPPEWPWSMRQTAVYHRFDLDSGDTVWINIKGNADISPRIQSLWKQSAPSDPLHIVDAASSFRATLATHLTYCEWAGENWAAYVGFLEDELQGNTRYALLADVPPPKLPEASPKKMNRTQTAPPPARRSTMSSIASVSKSGLDRIANARHGFRSSRPQAPIHKDNEMQQPAVIVSNEAAVDFTYDDLRTIQHIEDQANVTVLAIRSNISIINEMMGYYNTLRQSEEYEVTLGTGCDPMVRRFAARMDSILHDLKLHQSRVETLLHLLADRKALVCHNRNLVLNGTDLLQLLQLFAHRNMTANKEMTHRAHESAQKMESLTTHMKHIALKTEKETIFMRIITVVTLLFLPGTFVAVSRHHHFRLTMKALIPQTLMSTDIVKFQNDNDTISRFSWQALLMYFGITVPIMVITIWAAFWYRRREQEKLKQKRADAEKANLELDDTTDG